MLRFDRMKKAGLAAALLAAVGCSNSRPVTRPQILNYARPEGAPTAPPLKSRTPIRVPTAPVVRRTALPAFAPPAVEAAPIVQPLLLQPQPAVPAAPSPPPANGAPNLAPPPSSAPGSSSTPQPLQAPPPGLLPAGSPTNTHPGLSAIPAPRKLPTASEPVGDSPVTAPVAGVDNQNYSAK